MLLVAQPNPSHCLMGQTRADGKCTGLLLDSAFADYSGRWKKKEEVYSIKGGDIYYSGF
jgi:hypothetical protein